MILSVLAAAFTFTATATGVEKGTALEFVFAGKNSDRDYESMFLLETPLAEFCSALEKAGLKPGSTVNPATCRLWPVGCPITFKPALSEFVATKMPEGLQLGSVIYSGGTRGTNGVPIAATEMPASVLSLYTLDQSLFLFNGSYDQGAVYGCHTAAKTLKKGDKVTFTITWNDAERPQTIKLIAKPGNGSEILKTLKSAAEKKETDAEIAFDGRLTVAEATQFSQALAIIDSVRVKINGRANGSLFYRAFLPLVKWLDRKERMVQPFELTLGNPNSLVFIEEDWSVSGDDPKLTPRSIAFADAGNAKYAKTDTCFIFAKADTKLSEIYKAMDQIKSKAIRNWYVFVR